MVIDELLVVLGLDKSKFDQGQREALDAFRKTRQGADEFAKDVERQSMKMAEVFGIVRRGALGIVGAFAGGEAASFINHVAGMDAATGRFAKTMNTSVENLSTWQGMIRLIGGEGAAATSVLSSLQQQIESVRQGGGMFEGGFATLMNRSGVSIRDDADASLRKIRSYISGEVQGGRMTGAEAATWLRRVPGMNQDMVNLLSMTTREFNALADAARAAGTASKDSAEAGALLQKAFTALVLQVENLARGLVPLVALLTKPIGSITGSDASKAVGNMGGLNSPFEPGSLMDRLDKFMLPAYRRLGLVGGSSAQAAAGGGTRGDRNNNPGNIEDGPFARAHGAYGNDGRFAIFPDKASGESAMADLLVKNYQGLTLAQIQRKWVGNEDPNYLASMSRATGIGPNDVPNLNDPAVRAKIMGGMSRGEGTHLGARASALGRSSDRGGSSSTSTTDVDIGNIYVNAPNATDAPGIAKEIGPAMKRSSIAAPANFGLT